MTDFTAVIQPIATEWRQGEAHRWECCKLIHEAYAELGQYRDGLTAALCHELILGDDQVRNLGHAWDMRQRVALDPELIRLCLNITHFSRMYGLQIQYNLTDDDCTEWLKEAANNSFSVAKLAYEVAQVHDGDPELTFQKRTASLYKLARRWWQDSETYHIPDHIRAAARALVELLNPENEWRKEEE